MGSEEHVRVTGDEEGVLHIACGMVFGEVEGREDVPVIFDLRPLGDSESETGEDTDNLFAHQ